ncbi:MAG: hypothetical protein LUF30_10920 [Lachnospiraceae bacterium]|nr:hypothetical protein [Lachnospiraceae bacterium]
MAGEAIEGTLAGRPEISEMMIACDPEALWKQGRSRETLRVYRASDQLAEWEQRMVGWNE